MLRSDEFSKARLTFVMLICLGVATAILIRAAYIQLLASPRLETMARRQFHVNSLVSPRRGAILDRNREPLAINVETHSLAANPNRIHNKRHLALVLSKSTHQTYHRIFRKLSEKKEFVWIKRHLSDAELGKFKKWRVMDSDGEMQDGLWLVQESERVYPHGQLASHILGDVNVDSEGLEGVELWKNEGLRGRVVSGDSLIVGGSNGALGRLPFIDASAAKNVQDGESVSLTIDASLQYEIEGQLSSAVHRTGSRGGTVIVMNAVNGEILALANEPSFNRNGKNVSADRRRNRALTDGYEPGSTMKPVLLSSALGHGWNLSDQLWGEKGSFMVQNHKISEAEAHEKFEWLSLKKMIQVSSNVGAAKLALKLGADRYLKTIRSFGFGVKSGSGFPGEISGKIPPRKDWRPLTLANVGFGQGILVTPIQMLRAYAVFANGGWLIQPRLVKGNVEGDGLRPNPVRILPPHINQDVVRALSSVTEEGGTGLKAVLPGYRVAGKTGTAQLVDPHTGKYSKDKYVASFIGFPLDVEPKVVIFTSLLEPKGVYYASDTAAPLFKEVLNSVANRCGLPSVNLTGAPLSKLSPALDKARGKIREEPHDDLSDVMRMTRASNMLPDVVPGPKGWLLPSLKGLTPREVVRIFRGRKFQLEMIGTGVVNSQSPEGGKEVADGEKVRLILSEP